MRPYKATDPIRRQVKLLAEHGLERSAISNIIGIDQRTLQRHYGPEIGEGESSVTEGIKRQVEALAGYGLPHEMIGHIVSRDPKTLRAHFRRELDVGEARATAKIAQTLFNKAINGDTGCLIFWLKARAKWSEKIIEDAGDTTIHVKGGLPD